VNATLARHRLRLFLTMLSLTIASGSIVAVLGISLTISDAIAGSLNALGTPAIFVSVDPDQDDPQSAQLRYDDAAALRDANPALLRAVFPGFQHPYRLTTQGAQISVTVLSADGDEGGSGQAGRLLNAQDNALARRVCVLSPSLTRRLFADADPLEASVRINGVRFLVVGVDQTQKSNLLDGLEPSEYAEIPYTTFHAVMPDPVTFLRVIAQPGAQAALVREALPTTLRRLHGKQASYTIGDAHTVILTFKKALGIITFSLGAIDGIALIIAGVGIMNVMLATVIERTREIGMRKAIGASDHAIFMQFLTEALVVSGIGCGAGALLGCVAAAVAHELIVKLLGPATIPWVQLTTIVVAFSFLTGLLFGTYPALRARALEPMQALRA
jgi:putative ABC transport system permease protein